MPLKTPEVVIAKYSKYMTKDLVGRVAIKLAKSTYFGEAVLAASTITGNANTRPLDPRQLALMK